MPTRKILRSWLIAIIIGILLIVSSCTPAGREENLELTKVFESALLTATYAITQNINTDSVDNILLTETPTVIHTPVPASPTSERTPPVLPQAFHSDYINSNDKPFSYIDDTCKYIKSKWDPNNSSPGTVVMPIMFHSITDGEVTKANQISHDTVVQLLRDLKDQGFESITIEQLYNFLLYNAKIPPRSVVLIVDDRHFAEYYETHFLPQLSEYNWTVTNAWISIPGSSSDLIEGNVRLDNEGWVDHQAHGVFHNIPISNWELGTYIYTDLYGNISAEEYIHKELFGASEFIETTFGHKPIAYIWPGGGFSTLAVQMASDAGYTLGFTVNPRGPLMFNWIPLSDNNDPARPSYIPEGNVGNPLMVLPRYWDSDAQTHIDEVRVIGKEAAEYASNNKQVELEYYDIMCRNITGLIPTLAE